MMQSVRVLVMCCVIRPLINNSLGGSFDVITYYRYSKTASDSAPLSHLWLGVLVELKHLATGDLVELKHLTKDIYLAKFSTISMTWTVVHEKVILNEDVK